MKNILPLLALTSCANISEPMQNYAEDNQGWHKPNPYSQEYLQPDFKFPDPETLTGIDEYQGKEIEYAMVTREDIGDCVGSCHK